MNVRFHFPGAQLVKPVDINPQQEPGQIAQQLTAAFKTQIPTAAAEALKAKLLQAGSDTFDIAFREALPTIEPPKVKLLDGLVKAKTKPIQAKTGPKQLADLGKVPDDLDAAAEVLDEPGPAPTLSRWSENLSAEQAGELKRQFGGDAGLPALHDIFENACQSNPATFRELYDAVGETSLAGQIGVAKAMRRLYAKWAGAPKVVDGAYKPFEESAVELGVQAMQFESMAAFVHAAEASNFSPNAVANQLVQQSVNATQDAVALETARLTSDSVDHQGTKEQCAAWLPLAHEARAVLTALDAHHASPAHYRDIYGKLDAFVARCEKLETELRGALGSKLQSDRTRNLAAVREKAEALRSQVGEKLVGGAPMPFGDQGMVASGSDNPAIKAKQESLAVHGVQLTPNQAWALVAAERKGATLDAKYRVLVLERLDALNAEHGTTYDETHLDSILTQIAGLPLVTNYTFSKPAGANIGLGKQDDSQLIDLMLDKKTARRAFLSVWETGRSQASPDLKSRGAVEEQFGYAAALRRQAGPYQKNTPDTQFDPKNPEDMPIYAGLVSPHQRNGVATRYGPSFIVWKDNLRQRATHTPKDSWNVGGEGGALYTSNQHPAVLAAKGEPLLLRLAAAEATGQDAGFLESCQQKGLPFEGYFETQIHGDVGWSDVAEIVVGDGKDGEGGVEALVEKLQAFKQRHNFDFRIVRKSARHAQ